MKYCNPSINHINNSYEYKINGIKEALPDLGYDLEARFNYHYADMISKHNCDEEYHSFDFSDEISNMNIFKEKCIFDLPMKIEDILYDINNTQSKSRKYRYYNMLQNACERIYNKMISNALDMAPEMPCGNIFNIALQKMDKMGI